MIWAVVGKYIIGAGIVVGALAAFWGYGQYQYSLGQSDCNDRHNLAALEQFKTEAERLTGLSADLQKQAQELAKAKPKIIERYTRVEVEKPLPADCIIDADRMRNINDGIRQANTATKPE